MPCTASFPTAWPARIASRRTCWPLTSSHADHKRHSGLRLRPEDAIRNYSTSKECKREHDSFPRPCEEDEQPQRAGEDRGPRIKPHRERLREDRKSTRLNYSHSQISYVVYCLTKNTLS